MEPPRLSSLRPEMINSHATLPLRRPSSLIRFDEGSGELRERKYVVQVVAGPDTGQEFVLEATTRLGNHPDCGFSLGDPTVSRFHLELEPRPDGVVVRDLDSTNGTFLSGTRVRELVIEETAKLTLGRTTVRISIEEAALPEINARPRFGRMVGASAAMQRVFGVLERVAPTDSTILLLGETGTGKELFAEAIHQESQRAEAPFVIVDCGAVAASVIESELFGHARGAFTGAVSTRNGAFLEADGGTLFLDEIGELPLEQQPKLLRVLETGTVKRVGEDRSRKVSVRVIAATHRNLKAEVENGTFRRDLYFRLNVVPVHLPPLRERLEDLPVLTHAILGQLQRNDFEVSNELLESFRAYHWPGNVRELRNVIERAVSGGGADLDPDPEWRGGDGQQAAPSPTAGLADLPFKEAKDRLVEGFTREYLETLFRKHGGNVSAVARAAGIARNHVYNLLTRYGLGG